MMLALLYPAALAAVYLAGWLAVTRFFRRGRRTARPRAFTVIRPMRGVDAGLERNLRALLEADSEGLVQVLLAVETADDPAYAVARRVADACTGAEVVLTGPARGRMGKMHNMIEALPRARHEWIVFCDADARPDRRVLLETSAAIERDVDAFCALPDAAEPARLPELLVALSLNRFFVPAVVLQYRLGLGCIFSGAWMGFKRSCLERVGGLERFALAAADDFALSEAAQAAGQRVELLPCRVALYETGGALSEALAHLLRWTRIARASVTKRYAALPLLTPVAGAAWAALVTSRLAPALAVFLGLTGLRTVLSIALDLTGDAPIRPSLWGWLLLPFCDLGCLALWAAGWTGDTISWRGKSYRLVPGGRFEPLNL